MRTFATLPGLLLATLLLAACVTPQRDKDLETTLQQYESMIRWSQWDGAVAFIAPSFLEEHPITMLDIERLRQFRVTNYAVRSSTPYDEGNGLRQMVQIRLFNRNFATERAILDQQDWRWHADQQVWLLHSGLPDVTKAR